ncbi:glycoside hydrolase family 32 protein [Myriangium duriaei CBS 260.36]|uniref:Glycoside hydrolase family 32 protein n=1 Tax=Myriangium duriaei CBS 260.36 TaxID=1168546 RepID=A0A9P4J863_9PEZI|nr:glycoside hydrolase family 32 protein [Myriangium duriaei CBS 260.36]
MLKSAAITLSVVCLVPILALDLTERMVDHMGNNSLFTRWRPVSHITAPAGMQGESFMYDPIRKEYHLFYQWHPHHIGFGNISWGHLISNDLISWFDVGGWKGNQAIAVAPAGGNRTHDGLSAFSGGAQPVNLKGQQDGTLTVFYTGNRFLPTNFHSPYLPGTESQCIATSRDGGRTWKKHKANPVIEDPPPGWDVTGWRDFIVEPMPFLDQLIGQDKPHFYAVFGSGIKGVGSRVILYSAPAIDLTKWTFLGALWEPKIDHALGEVFITRHSGENFEMATMFSLKDDQGIPHYYVSVGYGPCSISPNGRVHNQWPIWYEGSLKRRHNGSVEFNPIASGASDAGRLYALYTFDDTKKNRRLLIGWAPDDVLKDAAGEDDFAMLQQGHRGAMCLPREVFVQTVRNIANNDGQLLKPSAMVVTKQSNGLFTARTLGMKPAPDVVAGLRRGAVQQVFKSGTFTRNENFIPTRKPSKHFELTATISQLNGRCGFRLAASPDGREYTTIFFDPYKNKVTVDRTKSSLIKRFNSESKVGHFRPYYTQSKVNGKVKYNIEPIKWDIFLDGSLLEIYINDRFALTTRIYPSLQRSTGLGVYVPDGVTATYQAINYWSGLRNIFPNRPMNSSTLLIWDTPEETNDYKWWRGN